MNIVEKLKDIGAGVGSIIEIGYRSDGIDRAIAEGCQLDEAVPAMYGYLFEVTAIGEESILCCVLEGAEISKETKYGMLSWTRDKYGERMWKNCSMLQKVGGMVNGKIVWTRPDLVNIYTRLQEG